MESLRTGMLPATCLLTFLGVACADAPAGPGEHEDAHLSFTDSDGGSYAARGVLELEGDDLAGSPFALAVADSVGGIVVTAFDAEAGVGDLFVLQLTELRTGAFGPCDGLAGGDCHGRVLEGLDAETVSVGGEHWEIVSGGADLSQAGPSRVVGGFESLTVRTIGTPGQERVLQDGTFDLPLLTDAAAVAAMRCILERATGAAGCS